MSSSNTERLILHVLNQR